MINFLKRLNQHSLWWQSRLGQAFVQSEAALVQRIFSTLFGYHLLVLGEIPFIPVTQTSPIHHRIWIHPERENLAPNIAVVQARSDQWPILSDSMDVVYLAQCLEWVRNPDDVLRETFRVLIAEGRVVISIRDPWSVWGLWSRLTRFIQPRMVLQPQRAISVADLQAWLIRVGFAVVAMHSHHCSPLTWPEKLRILLWPWWSRGTVWVAVKRVTPLTLVRPLIRPSLRETLPFGASGAVELRDLS